MKKGIIVFVFDDDKIKFLKSYSYASSYMISNGNIRPSDINVNLTSDIDSAFNWLEPGSVFSAYDNLKNLLKKIDNNIKKIMIVDYYEYKKYAKIKKIKELCQLKKKTDL